MNKSTTELDLDLLIQRYSDPIQGYDLKIEGLPFNATRFEVDFKLGVVFFETALTPDLIKTQLKVDSSCLTVSFTNEQVETPFLEFKFAANGIKPDMLGVSAGRSVAVVRYVGSFSSFKFLNAETVSESKVVEFRAKE